MLNKHPLWQFKYCPKCGSNQFVENDTKSKKCQTCGFVYYFNSSASTVALIINGKNELLVATRAKEPVKGTCDLPGGFVDMYETGEQAVIREVKEETNLDVTELKYLYSVPNTYVYSGFEVQTVDMIYLCKVHEEQVIVAADDVLKLQYINIDKLDANAFGLDSIKQVIKNIKQLI